MRDHDYGHMFMTIIRTMNSAKLRDYGRIMTDK